MKGENALRGVGVCGVALLLAGCAYDAPTIVAPAGAHQGVSVPTSETIVVGFDPLRVGKEFNTVLATYGTVVVNHAGAGVAVVRGVASETKSRIAAIAGVSVVAADQTFEPTTGLLSAQPVEVPITRGAKDPSTATLASWQWNMRAIGADRVWSAAKRGDPSVTVAILSSGIDYDNPDLAGRVDLTRSASFSPADDSITTAWFPGRHPISDYTGLGTDVATQVASNAAIFAGVSSRTTLIGVKVSGLFSNSTYSSVIAGILWAADHGADIAVTPAGASFVAATNGDLLRLLRSTFIYAHNRGTLVIAGSGNESRALDAPDGLHAPYCQDAYVMCVTAIGSVVDGGSPDFFSFYSNYGGPSISLAGPGGNADAANGFPFTTWPWGSGQASWIWSLCSRTKIIEVDDITGQPTLSICATGNFAQSFIGTQFAAAHAAGVAALVAAEVGRGRPDLLRSVLEGSVDDIGAPGVDPFFGRGRLNAARALGVR